jgi:hypothetical protein
LVASVSWGRAHQTFTDHFWASTRMLSGYQSKKMRFWTVRSKVFRLHDF